MGSIKQLIENKGLKWIFVGGKGGVGKTTISSSLATMFEASKKKVLCLSTDPAHNLSDVFNQKIGDKVVRIKETENLYALEITPETLCDGSENKDALLKLGEKVPGMDELVSFMYLFNHIDNMDFDLIVFDTAPTGHTLKFLQFPDSIETLLDKLLKFGGAALLLAQSFGGQSPMETITNMRTQIQRIQKELKDPNKATFVCVCISEFLSLYETERFIQSLKEIPVSVTHLVVNQLILKDDSNDCRRCQAKKVIQNKYMNDIDSLYGTEYEVVKVSMQETEVRGYHELKTFGKRELMGPE